MTIQAENNPIPESPNKPGLTDLPQWGLILVAGTDAEAFLQNQLTNSIQGLSPTTPCNIAEGKQGVRLVGTTSGSKRYIAGMGSKSVFEISICRRFKLCFCFFHRFKF